MPAWPASLPQHPLIAGYQETSPDLVVRSPMDTGPAKVRRRATAGVTQLRMAFRLTTAQLTTFRIFLQADLQDRALSFSWTNPVTGAAGWFRIVDPPQYEPAGPSWRVAVVMEMLP